MLLLRLEALLLLTLPSELSMRRFLGSFGLRESDQTGFLLIFFSSEESSPKEFLRLVSSDQYYPTFGKVEELVEIYGSFKEPLARSVPVPKIGGEATDSGQGKISKI